MAAQATVGIDPQMLANVVSGVINALQSQGHLAKGYGPNPLPTSSSNLTSLDFSRLTTAFTTSVGVFVPNSENGPTFMAWIERFDNMCRLYPSLASYYTGDPPPPVCPPATQEQVDSYRLNSRLAYSLLFTLCTHSLGVLRPVSPEEDPSSVCPALNAYKALQVEYNKSDIFALLSLFRSFLKLSSEPFVPTSATQMSAHVLKFNELFTLSTRLKSPIPENLMALACLTTLPYNQFNSVILSLSSDPKSLSFAAIRPALTQAVSAMSLTGGNTLNLAPSGLTLLTDKPPTRVDRPGGVRDYSKITCFNCDKLGHTTRKCTQPADEKLIQRRQDAYLEEKERTRAAQIRSRRQSLKDGTSLITLFTESPSHSLSTPSFAAIDDCSTDHVFFEFCYFIAYRPFTTPRFLGGLGEHAVSAMGVGSIRIQIYFSTILFMT